MTKPSQSAAHATLMLCTGMNSGVMLFRRTPWMEEFLTKVAALGRIPEPGLGKVLSSSFLQHTTASHSSTPAQALLVCKRLASQESLLSLGQAISAQGHRRT